MERTLCYGEDDLEDIIELTEDDYKTIKKTTEIVEKMADVIKKDEKLEDLMVETEFRAIEELVEAVDGLDAHGKLDITNPLNPIFVAIRIKTYGLGSDLTETNVICYSRSKEYALKSIEKDYNEITKFTAGDNRCLDGEKTYIVDEDNDNCYTYAIHEIKL